MNNAFSLDSFVAKPDERLKERETKLVKLIEALEALNQSREWSTLKQELFGGLLESIENRIKAESDKSELNIAGLYRLQGERKVARRFDIDRLIANSRAELAIIRKNANPGD